MILAVGIDVLDLIRRDSYLGRIYGVNSRLLYPDNAVVAIRLLVVAERTDEQVVFSLIHAAAHIFPVPADRFGKVHLDSTLSTFLIGSNDIPRRLVTLHPYISGRDARAGNT